MREAVRADSFPGVMRRVSRRALLSSAGSLAAGWAFARRSGLSETAFTSPGPSTTIGAALAALGRTSLRQPDSLPFPDLPPGSDTLPQIEHIVVLMLENHSFDNLLGVLGKGDGLTTRSSQVTSWNPLGVTATNPTASGGTQHAFHMPTTCQLPASPSQEWTASHIQYDNGSNRGFVVSPSGPVAMGYWSGADLPFLYGLARAFPVADRWFCSVLGQTDPNRRFLIAATSSGMTDDIALPGPGTSPGTAEQDALLATPANGTIFDRLSAYGVPWADYTASYPTGTTAELYPVDDAALTQVAYKPFEAFYTDCAAGALPAFTLLDPDYNTQSQENPQNMVVGEDLLRRVVLAVGGSPAWRTTVLVVVYDEHGGYYDHVPPPVALAPDAIAPVVPPGASGYDGFARYGFRVPAIVVSPFAMRGGVTHVLHDHTSVLAMVERKWNLPAMTFRDANANDLLDFLDTAALRAGTPTFPELPPLPPSGMSSATLACSSSGPGTIPPPGSTT